MTGEVTSTTHSAEREDGEHPVWWVSSTPTVSVRSSEDPELNRDVVDVLVSSADIAYALRTVASLLADVFGETVAILLLENTPGATSSGVVEVPDEVTATHITRLLHDVPLRYSDDLVGRALASRQITVLDDAALQSTKNSPGYEYVTLLKLKTVLVVPLWFRARPLGVINIMSQTVRVYTPREHSFLRQVAVAVAIAIENARTLHLVEQEQIQRGHFLAGQLTQQEQERKRIALDIHDSTLQSLIACLQQVRELTEIEDPAVQRIEALLSKGIGELRTTIHGLRPAVLDVFGLARALEVELEEFEQRETIATSFAVVGTTKPTGGAIDITLFRILQESLANVAKHARASSVEVRLDHGDGYVSLEVLDDGVGLQDKSRDGGIGVMGMKERAAALGGQVFLANRAGRGCCVTAILPVDAPSEATPT